MLITLLRRFSSKYLIDKDKALQPFKKVPVEKRVKRMDKIAKELFVLPKEAKAPNIDVKIVNIDTIKPQLAFKLIDTSLDSFFRDRKINTKNFNLLLMALSEQKNLPEAEIAFQKMSLFGVPRNPATYANIISNAAKNNNLEKVLFYYNEALDKFDLHIVTVNAMIHAYSRFHKPYEAEVIFRDAQRNNLRIDTATITSLINAFKYSNEVSKCWELYDNMDKWMIPKDDALIGLMIRICTATQEAEKAKKMWLDLLKLPSLRLTCLHYNALITALASRKDYAEDSIEAFDEMIQIRKIQPDQDTFIGVLEACSKIGNVKRAYELILMMNDLSLKPTKYIYAKLLDTYASAIKVSLLPYEVKTLYYEDAWRLFNEFSKSQPAHVDSEVLNSLLATSISFNKLIDGEELVIPLFAQFNVQPNKFTYEKLIVGLHGHNELLKIQKLYNEIKSNENNLSIATLNTMLQTFMTLRSVDGICEVLDTFKSVKKHPPKKLLRSLFRVEYLPHAIYYRIMSYDYLQGHPINDRPRTLVKELTHDEKKAMAKVDKLTKFDKDKHIKVELPIGSLRH